MITFHWYYIWSHGRPLAGVGSKDGELFWFEWNDNDYDAYEVNADEMEAYRIKLEKAFGKMIYLDERYTPQSKTGETPAIDFTVGRKLFTFSPKEVQNIRPNQG